jgi:hypothetical protein
MKEGEAGAVWCGDRRNVAKAGAYTKSEYAMTDRVSMRKSSSPRACRCSIKIAIHNAGRQSEELFGHSLPSWASTRDRTDCVNAITAEGIRDTAKIAEWIDRGCGRARDLLRRTRGRCIGWPLG